MTSEGIIIGGGIGGLATAIALRRVGIDVTVYERAPELQEVGAGLSLWSNAVLALRELGVDDVVVKRGSPIEMTRTLTPDGTMLDQTDIAEMSQRAGADSICIHRAALQQSLAEALPDSVIQTGRECIDIEADDHHVTARFADGGSATGDFLIGADGIHSVVRAKLFGDSPTRYAGYTCWRGIAEFDHPDFPLGLSLFLVGRGSQMGLFHCGSGRVYWFLTSNRPAGIESPRGGRHEELLALTTGWPEVLCDAIRATENHAILHNDIIDRKPSGDWGSGRATLLGDAAHSTTPNLGQGACQALEDAVILADSLRNAENLEAGLRAYEDRRRDRALWVVRQSWQMGKVFQLRNGLTVWLRNRFFRTKWAKKQGQAVFEKLLCVNLPRLGE